MKKNKNVRNEVQTHAYLAYNITLQPLGQTAELASVGHAEVFQVVLSGKNGGKYRR